MLRWLEQLFALVSWNLRTVRQRLGSVAAAVVGIAGVVAVFVAVLSIAEGFRAVLATTGEPDTALVLRAGADSEMTSVLGREEVEIVKQAPGVARGPRGSLASAELFVVVDLPKRTTGTDANVSLRGVEPMAFRIRPLEITAGRAFEPGRHEVIVGVAAQRQFSGLDVGSTLSFGQTEWAVVGAFTTGGTLADSEIWCDVKVLQPAYRRGDSFQTVVAKLTSPAAFSRFKDALTVDPRLNVQAERETDYYAAQSRTLVQLVTGLGTLIAFLMGIGAVFGALNTMYTAVAARGREIATLRALGFGGGAVVLSVLAEALLVAAVGGLLGGGLAYAFFNGYQASTMNWQSFSQVAFAFAVTPRLLVAGAVAALVMGLVGGFFPALRAARLPVASALREL